MDVSFSSHVVCSISFLSSYMLLGQIPRNLIATDPVWGERCAADRTRAFSISPPDLIWIFLTVNPKLSPWTRLGNDRFKHSARHRLGGDLDTWITWIPEMLEYQWPSFWVSTFINIGYKKGWFPIWHGETSVVFSMVFSMVFSVLEKWPKSDGSNDPAISSNPNFDEAFRPWSHC